MNKNRMVQPGIRRDHKKRTELTRNKKNERQMEDTEDFFSPSIHIKWKQR
jgi:hypothetical protein